MPASVSHSGDSHDAPSPEPTGDDEARRARLLAGDEEAFTQCFAESRPRLVRMVHFRLDPRLRGRIDAEDVLQEVYVDAVRRRDAFRTSQPMSFFVWLRLIVGQTLVDLHRKHIGAAMRDAGRERSLGGFASADTSQSLSFHLLGKLSSPSQAVMRAELSTSLTQALEEMNETDREILALRHFEELSNKETAEVLGIERKAASIRYIRALERLKKVLERVPGFLDSQLPLK
ncbi:MAG: sigma-70 family RNA polymerase sigma factor [Pirellulales bacterium]